jgi:hypothetical protein
MLAVWAKSCDSVMRCNPKFPADAVPNSQFTTDSVYNLQLHADAGGLGAVVRQCDALWLQKVVYMLSSKMEWTPKVSGAHLCC